MVCGNACVMSVKIALRGREGGVREVKRAKGQRPERPGGCVCLGPRSLGKNGGRGSGGIDRLGWHV